MGRASRWVAAGQNLGLALGTLLFCAAVLEILLRSTHLLGARRAWTTPDPVIGYRLVPGAVYWSGQENDHPVGGRVNRSGWIDNEWDDPARSKAVRIALLGDSFLEAIQVERESTFAALAERLLERARGAPVELMNFGLSGTTQSEQLLVLTRDALPLSPDMVVLFFYAGNDIADIDRATASHRQRPFFVPSGDSLVLDTSFAASGEYAIRRLVDPLKRRSALVSLLAERLAARRQRGGAAPGAIEEYALLCTAQATQRYRDNFALNLRLIVAMDTLLATRGIPFALVVLPLPWYRQETSRRISDAAPDFDPYCFERRLEALGVERGFSVLGLQHAFADADAAGSEPLLWRNVGHFTYAGHRLVAAKLAEWLAGIAPE
jgi:hypothetical protein